MMTFMSLVDRLRLAEPFIVSGLTLCALVLVASFTNRRSVPGAVLLGVIGVLWLLVNKPVEGVTLLPVARNHGLTTADLAGLAAIAAAGWRLLVAMRHRRRATEPEH